MEKKFSDETLDFWEQMFSEPNVCIDYAPDADPEKIVAEMRALRAAIAARRKEKEQRAAKKEQ